MAISLAKLTVLVGAGVIGSILVNEGRLSDVPRLFSGAFKMFHKHVQEDKNGSSSVKNNRSDYLLTQVNHLRQQLQNLQPSQAVTIIQEYRRGYSINKIVTVILVGVVGYGYIRWKGWKISDMMFVTQHVFTDARKNVANQMDSVSEAISTTKKHLTSRIDRVDCTLNDCLDATTSTRTEVSELCGELSGFHLDVESVHRAVQTLESKIVQIEGSQDFTTQGVYHLCQVVKKMDSRKPDHAQVLRSSSLRPLLEQPQDKPISRSESLPRSSSLRPLLEQPQDKPISRSESLPPVAAIMESGSPSNSVEVPRVNGTSVLQALRTATVSSFKDIHGLSSITRSTSMRRNSTEANGSEFSVRTSPTVEQVSTIGNGSSSSARFGWRLPSLNILTRSRSSSDAT